MIIEKILNDWDGVDLVEKRKKVLEFMEERAREIPEDILKPAVVFVKRFTDIQTGCDIVENFDRFGHVWWTRPEFHYRYGVKVRNMLRDLVCDDDLLPTENWDDYWQIITEMAMEIRDEKTREYTRKLVQYEG